MTERDIDYLLTHYITGVGPRTVRNELAAGLSIQAVIEKYSARIPDRKQVTVRIRECLQQASDDGYTIVTCEDPQYPKALAILPDPPLWLFVKGALRDGFERCIAVVGTRAMTSYGKSVTEDISQALVETGCTIVSGFMRGVDTTAHWAAVKKGRPTIAVLGSGCLHPVPPENKTLIPRVVDAGGAIISEFLPEQLATKYTFPQRNRIVASLAEAVIVIEAGAKSGALITARIAAEQGKNVYVVPGEVYSDKSAGCHWLIRQGAEIVLSVDDLLEQLGIIKSGAPDRPLTIKDPLQQKILALVSQRKHHIDELVVAVGQPTHEVTVAIMQLELENLIKNIGGNQYVIQ